MERDEWLEWRKQGVGASDVAGIVGLSKWSSPMSVYLDKTSDVDDSSTEAMAWGLRLENAILDAYFETTGVEVTARQLMVEHPVWDHHRATLDGLTNDRIVEAKNTSQWSWDEIPDHYRIQGQWQMHCASMDRVDFAVLHGGNRLAIYSDVRDDDLIAELIVRVNQFWDDYVIPRRLPPVDESAATHQALKHAWASTEGAVSLSEQAVEALKRRKDLKAVVKALEADIAACESVVYAELGEHETGLVDGEPLVTWKSTTVPEATRKAYEFRRLTLRGDLR
jgi:putative phage-type endonuclease